jgi:hypothetical protein
MPQSLVCSSVPDNFIFQSISLEELGPKIERYLTTFDVMFDKSHKSTFICTFTSLKTVHYLSDKYELSYSI